MTKVSYSHWVGIKKAIIQGVLFGLPLVLDVLPDEYLNLTLGAVLSYALNYLKYNLK